MSDAVCNTESSTACDASESPPILQNRQPIWRRHVFPASPAVSVDPFELPPSLTPALKRVKSRTKLVPKTQAVPDCSSTVVPSLFLRTSPRKKPPTEKNFYLVTQMEQKVDLGKCGAAAENAPTSSTDTNIGSQIPSRVDNNPYPVSLPPKKPRLAFLATSTSDFRSPRKPVTIEPDFQKPSSSTPLSRFSKTLRHSSASLSRIADKITRESETSHNDLPEKTLLMSPKLFRSRSSMNLRLTPERDLRERRISESSNATAPRASPKKKLQPSATLSDLRRSPSASTNRRRRASLSCSHSKEPLAKQLRKRSSSLELRDIETNEIALHRKRRVNYVKQVNVLDMVTTLTEIFPSQNTEQAVTLSTESVSSNDPEVKITPPPLGAADRDSQEDTNCNHDTLKDDELIKTHLSAGSEHDQGEAETTNSFVKSCPLETKLISSKTEKAANSNNRGELVEPERGQPVVVMNTMEAESGISFASIEKTAKDGSDERENDNNDDQIACSCSIEAGSSTSSCTVECVSDGATQEATANEIKISSPLRKSSSNSTNCATSNLVRKSKSEQSLDKRVRFQNVSVYYFARTQGISTVPKNGEVTLGMVDKHFTKRQFPLWYGRRPELTLPIDYEEEMSESENIGDVFDAEGLERCTAHQLPLFEGKTRIRMLKRSGVQLQKDENVESLESIRRSRILCGCQCESGFCRPETCQCALDGIGCQVDGPDEFGRSHPCSCTYANCLNPCGRIEFDPEHVKNHYRITMMRLNHAEQKGIYDSPQRIRFTSDGEAQSVSYFTPPPSKSTPLIGMQTQAQESKLLTDVDDPPTRKCPVTPVYKKSKQKRGLKVELIGDRAWMEPSEPGEFQEIVSDAPKQY
ncbi:hypothetical protein RB195_004071 [Necator americanus]|uniref:Cysteine/serine-rich nuclear protein N-terminal domain-containing protein n=1 Tax=Necator americanus TaxID=51031 RepID=A0ABR1BG67_NECAM